MVKSNFTFASESGRSEWTCWDRALRLLLAEADIETESKWVVLNVCFGEKSGKCWGSFGVKCPLNQALSRSRNNGGVEVDVRAEQHL